MSQNVKMQWRRQLWGTGARAPPLETRAPLDFQT